MKCPKCGSNEITAQKAGFNAGAAVLGDALLGPIGLLAGAARQNKIIITCLECGHAWTPGGKKHSKIFWVSFIVISVFVFAGIMAILINNPPPS